MLGQKKDEKDHEGTMKSALPGGVVAADPLLGALGECTCWVRKPTGIVKVGEITQREEAIQVKKYDRGEESLRKS